MKKYLFIIGWIFLCINGIYTQNIYDYDYDAAGNRIRRRVVTLKTDNAPNMPDEQRSAPSTLDDESLRLFPNPTRGTVVIETIDGKDIAGYRLSDANGKLIETKKLPGSVIRLDLSDRPFGVYLLEIVLDGERKYYKIIKQ